LLPVAAVVAVLGAAVLTGRAVAGPASAPRVLPAPSCPAVLGDALPTSWPSSTYLVPWGPVSGRVCAYPTVARVTPETAPSGQQSTLDATAVAEFAGLLEDLPAPGSRCSPASDGAADAAAPPGSAVVLLRYRPGATPSVGDELSLVVGRRGSCVTASNGLRTVQVDGVTLDRLLGLAPALGSVVPTR
jgi:hypothetical protein